MSCHATLKNKLSANFNSGARSCWGLGGGGGGGEWRVGVKLLSEESWLKCSCSLAWKLGVMAIKSEWVIKSCPKALNIPFRIALWNLSRALKNLDSLENYNSRQFLLVIFLGVCRQKGPEEVSFSNTSSDLASNIHPRFKSRKGSQTRHTWAEIMSSLLWLERPQKRFFTPFQIRILIYSFFLLH